MNGNQALLFAILGLPMSLLAVTMGTK